MYYKSQTIQDVSIRIHSIKEDGTDNTGDAANLSTIILDPLGNELTGTTDYTEATFTEIGTTGIYECLFASIAPVNVFTLIDQDNPYTVSLVSSTAGAGAGDKDVRIVSQFIGEVASEATSQNILAQVTGTGNRAVTIHIEDALAAPIADVLVRIGTASQYTDPSGDAIFALDDGIYSVYLRKAFVTFTVPESLTVAGDGIYSFTGAIFSPSVPTQPNTCVVYGYVIDNGGDPVTNATISINETDDGTFSNTQKIVLNKETTSDASGLWELEVIRSSELVPDTSAYQASITYGDTGFRKVYQITVPDADSAEFSTIIDS